MPTSPVNTDTGYAWIIVLGIAALGITLVLRYLIALIRAQEIGDTETQTRTNGGGVFWVFRSTLSENLMAKFAALVVWGLLLLVIAKAYPEFWDRWFGTGILFWLAQLVVLLLIAFPLWQRGNAFAKWVIVTMLILLVAGSWRASNGITSSSGLQPVKYISLSPKAKLLTLRPDRWTDTIIVPEGSKIAWRLQGPDGTEFFVKVNEMNGREGVIYKVSSKQGGIDKLSRLLMVNGRPAYEPVTAFEVKNETISFSSGEPDKILTLEVQLKPI